MNFCQYTAVSFAQSLCNLSPFWFGGGVGLICAVIGAVLEQRRWRSFSAPENDKRGLPGCMPIMAGFLGFVGVVLLLISLFMGGISQTMAMGLGVGAGFIAGFVVLVGIWLLFTERRK